MLRFYLRDVGNKPVYYDSLHNENIRYVGCDSRTLNSNGSGAEGGIKIRDSHFKNCSPGFFILIENLDVGIFYLFVTLSRKAIFIIIVMVVKTF